MQGNVTIELFKKMIYNIVPIELKYFERKFLNLKSISNFRSVENLLEKIIENQNQYKYIFLLKLV